MVTKKQLKRIKQNLPKHYAKTIAEQTGKSEALVYKVLSGDINNVDILSKAIELAYENSLEKAKIMSKIDKL